MEQPNCENCADAVRLGMIITYRAENNDPAHQENDDEFEKRHLRAWAAGKNPDRKKEEEVADNSVNNRVQAAPLRHHQNS